MVTILKYISSIKTPFTKLYLRIILLGVLLSDTIWLAVTVIFYWNKYILVSGLFLDSWRGELM